MALLAFNNVSFAYPNAKRRALDHVSFSLPEGGYYVVCGESGCGKTTLLRHAKAELTPAGAMEGQVLYGGKLLKECDSAVTSQEIGFVQQNPDNQIVTDFVWHELAFGLENMALPTPVIRRRVAEMVNFFGLESIFRSKVHELSGGQKQLLNLASIMAMNPRLLILDEPTSMLDPVAARNLLDAVRRINRELGVAVLLTEHRLEDVFPVADRVLIMQRGELIADAPPGRVASDLSRREEKSRIYFGLPSAVRIFSELGTEGELPLTLRDARKQLSDLLCNKQKKVVVAPMPDRKKRKTVLKGDELWFRYQEDGEDILRGTSVDLAQGELLCLLGGNGAGKTTLLRMLAGIKKPLRGKVKAAKGTTVAMLPQHPQALFTHDTLLEDFMDSADDDRAAVDKWAGRLELDSLYHSHPFDLSGGEMQRAAMCKLLLRNADTLLLDEPTKGLDAYLKQKLADILKGLNQEGVSILAVTHDIEFAAQYATRCAMLFDGFIASEDQPRAFFAGNRFYTTAANQIAAEHFPDAITCEEVIACCRASFTAAVPLPQ